MFRNNNQMDVFLIRPVEFTPFCHYYCFIFKNEVHHLPIYLLLSRCCLAIYENIFERVCVCIYMQQRRLRRGGVVVVVATISRYAWFWLWWWSERGRVVGRLLLLLLSSALQEESWEGSKEERWLLLLVMMMRTVWGHSGDRQ